MSTELNIKHNAAAQHFEYTENGKAAFIEYKIIDRSIAFMHTYVPPEMEGRGIAGALTVFAFNYAKEHHMPVIVYCPYIRGYVKKHPELKEQLDPEFLFD